MVGTVDLRQNRGRGPTSEVSTVYENQDINILAEAAHRLKGIYVNT